MTKPQKGTSTKENVLCFLCLFVAFLLGFLVPVTASNPTESNASTDGPLEMAPGESIHHELAPGSKKIFEVSVEADKLLRFSIDKGDLLLSTTLYDRSGTKLFEHLSQDFEIVEISFPVQSGGIYRIQLQSLEKKEKRPYELSVQPLKVVTTSDRKNSEARQAMAHAEMLRAEWKEDSLLQATAEYDRAGLIWRSTGDFTNAARVILRSGDVYVFLSQYHEALKRYQDARALTVKKRDRLGEASALSQIARVSSYFGKNDVAQEHVTKALKLLKTMIETNPTARNAYGEALIVMGEITYAKGNFNKALTHFDEARNFLKDDREGLAKAHLFTAYIAGSIGNLEGAQAEITKAHDLYNATNNKRGEGLAFTALGKYYSLRSKDKTRVIEFQSKIQGIFHYIGDRHSEAITLNALGELHEKLNDYTTAFNYYEAALQLFRDSDSVDGTSLAMCNIARMHLSNENVDEAIRHYERCLSLSRAAGNQRIEIIALNQVAPLYARQGRHELASKQYQKTQKFYEMIGDLRGQAKVLNAHGDLLLRSKNERKALDLFSRALPLSEQTGDQNILITTLYNLARTNLKLGSPELAHHFIKRSLNIIEQQRANLASADFRLSYFSGVQENYKLCSEILMQLDQLHPGESFAAEALSVSERGRARLLLDLITDIGADLRQGPATKELLDHEREIRGLFRSHARYRLELSLSKKDPTELAEIDKEMAQLKTNYQAVLAQLKQENPFLEESTLLSLEQIQNELRDTNTMILEYQLGDEHSYVWAITANSFHGYELPARKYIEDAAREVYDLLTAKPGTSGAAATIDFEKRRNLSQMLLGPLAEQLCNRKLVVIPEGVLQYIPFDALLVPIAQTAGPIDSENASPAFLMEANEITVLPSISTLIAIRRARKHASSTSKLVAVIADPVFSRSDDRVQSESISSSSALAATDENLVQNPTVTSEAPAFARLVHASEEADAISAEAPLGTTLVARGFDANPETAMSSDVGQYQIVHFATHGFVDSEHPERSSIILTNVDRNGVKTDGSMSLQDIYNLDLSSELIVLSACQTALGKDVKGEGFVGLAHGFMSAGSKSVIASLWKVDDRATAVLMSNFYHSIFQEGLPPVAALRAAKLKMIRDKNWSAPYYWAGFVFQGDYESRIEVRDNSRLYPPLALLSLVLISSGLIIFLRRRRQTSPAKRN